jgi:purine-binding chemotaxis protein CheW
MENQIVIFQVAREYFGVDIAAVESVIKRQTITVVPKTPSCIEGIINIRGKVLPVINLKKRFGLSTLNETKSNELESSDDQQIMIVSIAGTEVGMIVNFVSEVLTIPEGAVEPIPPIVTTIDSEFIIGIAKLDKGLIILLNMERVLSIHEQQDIQSLPVVV